MWYGVRQWDEVNVYDDANFFFIEKQNLFFPIFITNYVFMRHNVSLPSFLFIRMECNCHPTRKIIFRTFLRIDDFVRNFHMIQDILKLLSCIFIQWPWRLLISESEICRNCDEKHKNKILNHEWMFPFWSDSMKVLKKSIKIYFE